ncbi:MAG: hypothetical protein HY707_00860 [Ignavibacteriae bacterium]|nr:hypothetical protein [Ignavibacteriota bacterium]
MKSTRSIINVKEIQSFYQEYCHEQGIKFTKKKFQSFVDCCERDFFQWLKENLKYFESQFRKAS